MSSCYTTQANSLETVPANTVSKCQWRKTSVRFSNTRKPQVYSLPDKPLQVLYVYHLVTWWSSASTLALRKSSATTQSYNTHHTLPTNQLHQQHVSHWGECHTAGESSGCSSCSCEHPKKQKHSLIRAAAWTRQAGGDILCLRRTFLVMHKRSSVFGWSLWFSLSSNVITTFTPRGFTTHLTTSPRLGDVVRCSASTQGSPAWYSDFIPRVAVQWRLTPATSVQVHLQSCHIL